MFRRKHWKINNLYSSNRKRSYKIYKNGKEITKNISCILQLVDSARCMACSLSDLANNLSEGIHKVNCKYEHHDKKCETCGSTNEICNCLFEYTNFKDDLIEYKCLYCKKKNIKKSLM